MPPAHPTLIFDDPTLLNALESASPAELDAAEFGIIVMDGAGTVTHYNATESRLAGLRVERVVGLNFFTDVGPCTNNYLVAARYEEPELDAEIDYVFTWKMKPTPVRLRMLKRQGGTLQYLAVLRK